jgi:hypothetical protein
MIASAGVPYESLPFLNVFSPEYAKNPLGAIAELGAGHVLARSPRGLECLSYDLSWELLRDERFPVGFEELLIMGGIAPESAAYHFFARNTAALEGEEHRRQRRCLDRYSARRRSNGRAKLRDVSSKTCSITWTTMNSILPRMLRHTCRRHSLLSDRRADDGQVDRGRMLR